MPPILSSFGALQAIGRGQRAGARKRVELVLASNANNYVLDVGKVAGYEPGNTDVELIVNAGVVIGSASTGSFALDIDTSWAAGDTIKIVNNGTIAGRGAAAAAGGPALRAQRPVSIDNAAGVVAGAGGGGGSGGSANALIRYFNGIDWPCGECGAYCSGGLGGSGQGSQGADTSGGAPANCQQSGSGPVPCDGTSGPGGAGGAYGNSGSVGTSASNSPCGTPLPPGTGFAAGACTSGNANITWLAAGTRHGALN